MKLRNKKTGEIIKDAQYRTYSTRDGFVISTSIDKYPYKSLKEFCEDWEDYVPQEPLIKDEKIRKAVRAWAEANGLTEKLRVINEHFDCCKIIGRCDSRNICLEIEFKTTIAHVNKNQTYTIAELCGEEEE